MARNIYPTVRSEKLAKILKSRFANNLIEAIEKERVAGASEGKSGSITVKRVGAFKSK